MILYCTNPHAKHIDTYVQSVTTERLVFGKAYEVGEKLARVLLAAEGWATDPPGASPTAAGTVLGLGSIVGIGPRRKEALAAMGITTLQHLIDAHAVTVDEGMDGSSLAQVLGWQNEAKKLISEIEGEL